MTGAAEPAPGGPAPGPRRSAARLAAVQAIYEMDMVGAEPDMVLQRFLAERWKAGTSPEADSEAGGSEAPAMTEPEVKWLGDLVHGVAERGVELDGLISAALADGMSTARLESLLRSILRAAAFELSAKAQVPAVVVISEYVDVADAFFDKPEVKLVNGVLDRMARTLRDGEF